MKRSISNFALCFLLTTFSCDKTRSADATSSFDTVPVVTKLNPLIGETSGIADSKKNKGFLWVHEDSGNPPDIKLVSHNGTVEKSIRLKGAINRDWEDMALAGTDLYVADIGDNNKVFADYTMYYFPEPLASVDTVKEYTSIKFKYPDGSHDAEAFLVDAETKNIYIITKSDNPAKIFKISHPYTGLNTATEVGSLKYGSVVSAALSTNGREIIVKTYGSLNHYVVAAGETIEAALQKKSTPLPYILEPQGEAVTFAADNSGYFTLSEKGFSSIVNLYFYKRK
ncbi:MAG TPA: hypothetical protein VEZ55_07880 [Chitinophagaceae bacterium]|nr:hypothetical protein [Chitinophagaceae bacterium]